MKTFFSEEKLIKQFGNSTSLSKRTSYFWANQNPPSLILGCGGGEETMRIILVTLSNIHDEPFCENRNDNM